MRPAPSRPPCLVLAVVASLLAGCGGGGTSTPACSATPQAFVATAAWQAFTPAPWSACSIEVKAPALATDERLAVLVVNASGTDNAAMALSASGTSATVVAPDTGARLAAATPAPGGVPPDLAAPIAIQQASLARWLSGPAPGEARRARGAVRAAAAIPATRSFCTYLVPGFTSWTRKTATLLHESAHAAYYATDDVKAGVAAIAAPGGARPDLWSTLDSYYEGIVDATRNPTGAKNIRGTLDTSFGGESDYDANGKMIFLFTNLSGTSGSGGTSFVAGYFDPNDLQPADDTTGCTAGGATHGSNAADMLYLMDPVDYARMGYALDTVIDSELPAVMAHELQHDALFTARCLKSGVTARCSASSDATASGDLWLNEGLSMVSEDLAGFGLNSASGRQRVAAYLTCASTTSHTCHETASMTAWPDARHPDPVTRSTSGDPYGNYGAVHAFLRWHLDQQAKVSTAAAQAFTRALESATVDARSAVAAQSGLSFEEGSARFASATLFSGWSADPAPTLDFAADAPWSPLHARVAWPSFDPLGASAATLTLRTDAGAAYQTGLGSGADATLTLQSSAALRPTLVVARVKKALGTTP
jgi:hypothetical protein